MSTEKAISIVAAVIAFLSALFSFWQAHSAARDAATSEEQLAIMQRMADQNNRQIDEARVRSETVRRQLSCDGLLDATGPIIKYVVSEGAEVKSGQLLRVNMGSAQRLTSDLGTYMIVNQTNFSEPVRMSFQDYSEAAAAVLAIIQQNDSQGFDTALVDHDRAHKALRLTCADFIKATVDDIRADH